MEDTKIGTKLFSQLEDAITRSCKSSKTIKKFEPLHQALLKKYYNATDVSIDYHRHRIKMNIVMDDSLYSSGTVNTHLPLLPTNISYDNLMLFLISRIEMDKKNLGFYAQVLKAFNTQKQVHALV
jgi:hypothetical protein